MAPTLLLLLPLAVVVAVLSPGRAAGEQAPHDEAGYCPRLKDPMGVMDDDFKEMTCDTYRAWCANMATHPFSPTSSQQSWWDVLGVTQFYKHMEGDYDGSGRTAPRRRGKRQSRRPGSESRMRRVVRKDYMALTEQERARFHAAVQRLKATFVDGTRAYDIFVGYHQASMAPGAHFGPGFMTWHREFLLRFENALREIDPEVSLPYWNSNADSVLGDAAVNTVMWTPDFVGTGHGFVNTGPFANWPIPFESQGRRHLYRGLNDPDGPGRAPRLFHDDAVASIVDAPTYRDITWNVNSAYESHHGATHNWIGGVMRDLANSPSDPVFFMHHAFLDCLFERMLQNQRSRGVDVRFSYPNDTEALGVGERQPDGSIARRPQNAQQYALAPMAPFAPLRNMDGLRADYTDMYYTCAPPATCSRDRLDCGAAGLFCETGVYKCAPRLKVGSACGAFSVGRREEEANPCYKAVCCEGVCSETCENSVGRRPSTNEYPSELIETPEVQQPSSTMIESVHGANEVSSAVGSELAAPAPAPPPAPATAPAPAQVPVLAAPSDREREQPPFSERGTPSRVIESGFSERESAPRDFRDSQTDNRPRDFRFSERESTPREFRFLPENPFNAVDDRDNFQRRDFETSRSFRPENGRFGERDSTRERQDRQDARFDSRRPPSNDIFRPRDNGFRPQNERIEERDSTRETPGRQDGRFDSRRPPSNDIFRPRENGLERFRPQRFSFFNPFDPFNGGPFFGGFPFF